MNMISERTMDIYLVHGETRVPARLYVRFRPDGVGVYLGLHSDVVEAEAGELVDGAGGCAARQVTPGHFLDALAEGIFPGLPEGTAIELDHVVELFSGSSRKGTVPLRETMTGARIGEEPVVVFTLRFELDGHPIEVTEAED